MSGPQVAAGALGLILAVFAGWAVLVEDPLGGEPIATASIPVGQTAQAPDEGGKTGPENPSRYDGPADASARRDGNTITIIDGSSGKRQEIVLPGAPKQPAGDSVGKEQLLERTDHGRIPKVGPTGVRPVEAYSSAAGTTQGASDGPRIAIIVGGLGIGVATTTDALSRLPPAVTLAFVPHGANLNDLAARARARGHEILLQVAMEPFDYPDNDPGPQTLLTTLQSEQNLERLKWQMSRLQGYVGLMNLMGARFLTSEKALSPVLSEIAKRGLLFVDDSDSTRSHAGDVAAAITMPFTKAEERLDAVPAPREIDRALARLEATARKNGIAVGTASALPVSIERIVHWAKGAEARGFTLVPVTAAALKPRSS